MFLEQMKLLILDLQPDLVGFGFCLWKNSLNTLSASTRNLASIKASMIGRDLGSISNPVCQVRCQLEKTAAPSCSLDRDNCWMALSTAVKGKVNN